ncbi:Frizzled-4 [Gryllus bimaculatus]|nr:Frizzled-4 [Gryllus bimaculatus]
MQRPRPLGAARRASASSARTNSGEAAAARPRPAAPARPQHRGGQQGGRGRPSPPLPPPARPPAAQHHGRAWAALGGVPLACVVAAHVHEWRWRAEAAAARPLLWVALLRVCMSLAAGAATLPLAWGPGTLRAFSRCFRRVEPCKTPPAKCYPHSDAGAGAGAGAGQLLPERHSKNYALHAHQGNETSV